MFVPTLFRAKAKLEREAGVGSTNFQKLLGAKQSGSIFYIIYIFIYFDVYILKKHAKCQIGCKKHENVDLTTGLMMVIKTLYI